MKFVMVSETEYRVATAKEIADGKATDVIKTVDTGMLLIKGLDNDTYHLIETKAPEGYNVLKTDQTITVDKTYTWDNEKKIAAQTVKIMNSTGALLPSTGGIGTTIFTVVGGVLILAALAGLVMKRRTSAM
jgi:LPXTG-motif cell wall-anchored protein